MMMAVQHVETQDICNLALHKISAPRRVSQQNHMHEVRGKGAVHSVHSEMRILKLTSIYTVMNLTRQTVHSKSKLLLITIVHHTVCFFGIVVKMAAVRTLRVAKLSESAFTSFFHLVQFKCPLPRSEQVPTGLLALSHWLRHRLPPSCHYY
jgi:hypothetical protein